MAENERHFCMALGPQRAQRSTRAAVVKDLKWEPGDTIVVRFIDGDPDLRARVQRVAEEWTGPDTANLAFEFVRRGPADIRIAFVPGHGSWSYLGTVCHQIDPADQTMNYGWLTPDSPDDEVQRVVRHEFGHALGLIHEHQNPNRPIPWNKDAVVADLSGPPNNWDLDKIQTNMFAQYDPDALQATETDRSSIMMYPIPASWTTDGFSVGLNTDISAKDRELIRAAYPA